MINVLQEETASLAVAATWPVWPRRRGGKMPSVSWLYRMAKHGYGCGPDAVKLETVRVGGTLCTSPEACARFIARMSAAGVDASGLTAARSQRRAVAAEAELAREGF